MRSGLAWVSLGFAVALLPSTAHAQTDWVKQKVLDRIIITGNRELGLHFERISGDQTAYSNSNYGGLGGQRFTDMGYLRIEGRKVANLFNVDLSFQDSRFRDPQDEKMTLDFDQGNWSVGLGDVNGTLLNTNRFTSFSRRVRGFSAGYKSGPLRIKTLRTETRGEPRSVSMQGNNTRGPYYLQSNQILRGSERVTVDGVEQKFGEDYTIDYTLGAIIFESPSGANARIIPPSSTIVATYESLGFSGSSGVIEGAGLSYDIKGGGRLGLTGIRQLSGATNRGSSRLESFQGFGPSTTPYTQDFAPNTTAPITVRVDGVLQIVGIDYRFDSANPSVFYMNRFVPSTSVVDVVYTPLANTGTGGDRSVWSVDYNTKIGSRTTLSLAQAFGEQTNTDSPKSGQARSAELSYDFGKGRISGATRMVDDDFVSVQSAGFNRNEKASNISLEFTPNPGRRWQASMENSSVASVQSTGVTRSRFTRTALSHQVTPKVEGNMPLTLSFERTTNQTGTTETNLDTAALSTAYRFGRWDSTFSLANSQASGDNKGSVRTLSAQGRYRATERLNLTFGAEQSQVTSDTGSGTGREYRLGMDYRPSDKYRAALTFSDSDSGGVSNFGSFTGGYSYGYSGNGFTNGPLTQTNYSAATGRRLQLDLEARPSDTSVLGTSFFSIRSEGSVTSNSTTTGATAYGSWEASDAFRVLANASYSRTNLIGSPTEPVATTLGLNLDGQLGNRWSYNTRLSTLFSSGNGDFDQNSLSYAASVSYRVAQRQSLGFSYQGNKVSGYLPQDDNDWSVNYRYQIWQSLALGLVYRNHSVVNRDPSVSSGAYSASGLHLELSFNFGR
jgi:hypothetical protein